MTSPVEIASAAAAALAQLSAMIGTVKNASEKVALHDKLHPVQQALHDLQAAQIGLLEENSKLRQQVADRSELVRAKAQYSLQPIDEGKLAYRYEGSAGAPHWACPSCFASDSIMPMIGERYSGTAVKWRCCKCSLSFLTGRAHGPSFDEPINYANGWMTR